MIKRTYAKILIILFPVIAIVGLLIIISLVRPPNAQKADKILVKDSGSLEKIVYYLESSNCESFYFYKYNKTNIDNLIEDQEVRDAIAFLFDQGYSAIGKNGNTIYFLRWTRWRDFGAGIAYSIDGTHEPQIDYLVKLEPLSKDHWYYYEEN